MTHKLLCWHGWYQRAFYKMLLYTACLQVLVGAEDRRVKKLSCGAAHTGVITEAGQLYMFGCGDGGRLGESRVLCWLYSAEEGVFDVWVVGLKKIDSLW